MKGTIFLKDRKVTLFIGDPTKVPTATIELTSPQFVFDDNKVTVLEGELSTVKK